MESILILHDTALKAFRMDGVLLFRGIISAIVDVRLGAAEMRSWQPIISDGKATL